MKSLGSIRIKEKTLDNMDSAIKKYNSKNIFNVSKAEFVRMSIELLSQLILKDQPIPMKLQSDSL